MSLKEGERYRWVTTPTNPVIIDSRPTDACASGTHTSMIKRHHLTGQIFGGFLEIKGDDIIFVGSSQTVGEVTAQILADAIKRGIIIDR